MNKNTNLQITSQHKSQKSFSFRQDAIEYLHLHSQNLPPAAAKVFSYIVYMFNKYSQVFVKQETIGYAIGKTREHVNKAIKLLVELGFIAKQYRINHPCIYKLNELFYQLDVRRTFSKFFDPLKFIPLFVFISAALESKSLHEEKVTHSIRNIYIKQSLNRQRVILTREQETVTVKNTVKSKNLTDLDYYKSKVYTHKGERVSEVTVATQVNPIPEYIRELSWLCLTKWGQIKLTPYCQESVEFAASQKDNVLLANDPFKYFVSLCVNYCRDRQIKPDWHISDTLIEQYPLPDNVRFYMSERLEVPKEKDFHQRERSGNGKQSNGYDSTRKKTVPPDLSRQWKGYAKKEAIWDEDVAVVIENARKVLEIARTKPMGPVLYCLKAGINVLNSRNVDLMEVFGHSGMSFLIEHNLLDDDEKPVAQPERTLIRKRSKEEITNIFGNKLKPEVLARLMETHCTDEIKEIGKVGKIPIKEISAVPMVVQAELVTLVPFKEEFSEIMELPLELNEDYVEI